MGPNPVGQPCKLLGLGFDFAGLILGFDITGLKDLYIRGNRVSNLDPYISMPNSDNAFTSYSSDGRQNHIMTSTLTRSEAWSLLTLSAACVGILVNTFQGDGEPLVASLAFSGIAFAFTFSLIRWLGGIFVRANIKGRDMSKSRKVEM